MITKLSAFISLSTTTEVSELAKEPVPTLTIAVVYTGGK